MFIKFILIIFLFSSKLFGQSDLQTEACKKQVFFGHNLSHTSDTLCQGSASVGAQVLAYGATDSFLVATSPWLIQSYQMFNLYGRYKIDENSALEIAYFKACFNGNHCVQDKTETIIYGPNPTDTYTNSYKYLNGYSMDALWITKINKLKYNDHYTLYINFNFQYYFDQTLPFSLKRPARNPKPIQFAVSTLHVVNLTDQYFLNGEVGLLLPTDTLPYLHFGSSLAYRGESFAAHLGFSYTAHYQGLLDSSRLDLQQAIKSYNQTY